MFCALAGAGKKKQAQQMEATIRRLAVRFTAPLMPFVRLGWDTFPGQRVMCAYLPGAFSISG
jgi:hypothetical protein